MVRDIKSFVGSFRKRKGSGIKLRGVTAAIALFAVASSLDYGRAAAVKADLEASTQAAANAASAAICQSNEERAVLAIAVFNSTYNWTTSSSPMLAPQVTIDKDWVFVTAKEQVETSLARVAGVDWMEVGAVAQAPSGNRWKARACLASASEYLDVLLTLAASRGQPAAADPCQGGRCEPKRLMRKADAPPRYWGRYRSSAPY